MGDGIGGWELRKNRQDTKTGDEAGGTVRTWLVPAIVAVSVVALGVVGYFTVARPSGAVSPSSGIANTGRGPASALASGKASGGPSDPTVASPSAGADDDAPGLSPVTAPEDAAAGTAGGADDDAGRGHGKIGPPTGPPTAGAEGAGEVNPTAGAEGPASSGSTDAVLPGEPVDCAAAKCVALTFDDGPDPHSDAILDVLAAKGVRATFFIQGYRVNLFPDQLKREVTEGHEIGNHTWNHKNLTTLSPRAIKLQ
ncbi:MAG: polysaccharide deacetylase family protein, partial [Bifidobacteriaceae bacterium]|nr:polysaccharide deacetylase family protein [Bifidobacteriaceae bacterium]